MVTSNSQNIIGNRYTAYAINHLANLVIAQKTTHLTEYILSSKDTTQYFLEFAVYPCGPRHKPYTVQIC